MIGLRRVNSDSRKLLLYTTRPWTKKIPVVVREENDGDFTILSKTNKELDRIRNFLDDRLLIHPLICYELPGLVSPINTWELFEDLTGYIKVPESTDIKSLKTEDNFLILEYEENWILR